MVQTGPEADSPLSTLPGERKQVTILFCDLKSSMERSERVDPDPWFELIDRFYRLAAKCVRHYGGKADFTGDGLMAFFGAPVAYEDHAQRACHAALDLREKLSSFDAEQRALGKNGFPVRIGIHSGEVVVAPMGEGGEMKYTPVGHPVGLADRIQSAGKPGAVVISERTARLVASCFELAPLGRRQLKGHAEPIELFEVVSAPFSKSHFRREPNYLSAFSGRDREMGLLMEALGAADASDPPVVGVIGEPGVGKSRLLFEFSSRARKRGMPVHVAHGLAHGRQMPLLPVLELFRDLFEIVDADSMQVVRHKVAATIRSLAPDLDADLPLLFDFLGADVRGPREELGAEARRRRILEIATRIMQARAERSAALIIFEDLQWFDAASLSFVEDLVAMGTATRTLFVFSFRPEFEPPLASRTDYVQLRLLPLDVEAIAAIVASRAGSHPSLVGLPDQLTHRTDGNPLFCEEILAALIEEGVLVGEPGSYRLVRELGELRIPERVQTVLAARIDRLDPAEKQTLQAASVIGLSFSFELLVATANVDELELSESLRALIAAKLVFERVSRPGEYVFKHALTADVTYDSLLMRARRELHGRVARGLERLNQERADERAALISYHYEKASEPITAGHWSARGAEWARTHDLKEAVRLGRRAGTLLGQAEGEEETELLELRLKVLTRAAQGASRRMLPSGAGEEVFEEPRALAQRIGNMPMAVMATVFHGSHHFFSGHAERALVLYREGYELARASGDREIEIMGLAGMLPAYLGTGWPTKLLACCERGLELSEGNFDRGTKLLGRSPGVNFLLFKASALVMLGRFHEAITSANEAVEQGRRRSGEPENIGWALWMRGWVKAQAGAELNPADDAAESLKIARRIGNRANEGLALGVLVTTANLRGQHTDAERRAATVLVDSNTEVGFSEFELLLGKATALAAAANPQAVSVAGRAVQLAQANGMGFDEARARVVMLQALRMTEPAATHLDGESHLQRIEDLIEARDVTCMSPHVCEQRAELERIKENPAVARAGLERARDLFERMGAGGHQRRLVERLDQLAA